MSIGRAWHESGEKAAFLEAFQRFVDLAEKTHTLFCETDDELLASEGHFGWLAALFDIAWECPTAFVSQETGIWGINGEIDEDRQCDLLEERVEISGCSFPLYPLFIRIADDVFHASAHTLRMLLEPNDCRFVTDDPHPRLTPWQLQAVTVNPGLLEMPPVQIAALRVRDTIRQVNSLQTENRPRYRDGILWLGHFPVKRIKRGSTVLHAILSRFEELGWPPIIDSPINGYSATDIHDAVRKKLADLPAGGSVLHFKSVNSGYRVSWELRELD
jgi:hypothetical protein